MLVIVLLMLGCCVSCGKNNTSSNKTDSGSDSLPSGNDNSESSGADMDSDSSSNTSIEKDKNSKGSAGKKYSLNAGSPSESVGQIELGIGEKKKASPKPGSDLWKLIFPMSGGADAQAETRRNSILNAADTIKAAAGKTTYYVSPDGSDENDGKSVFKPVKTLEAELFENLQPGDAVLFERGGLWRVGESSIFKFKKGVSYGAYGKGDKPAFYGSEQNYARRSLWEPSNRKYVWKMLLTTGSAGFMVINDGEQIGELKNGITGLMKNGDFYHSTSMAASTDAEDYFYLYCDKGNPGDVYDEIELCLRNGGVNMSSDTYIQNICFKYFGGLATAGGGSEGSPLQNVHYENCEFGWVGGSYQNSRGDRYGNALQVHNNCKDITVDNCWFYHIVDAAITYQSSTSDHNWGDVHQYENIRFDNNLIEYSGLGIEFWSEAELDIGYQKNISVSGNIMRFAGYGGCATTTNGSRLCFICGSRGRWYGNRVSNFVIENNIFDCSARYIVYWEWSNTRPEEAVQPGLTVRNNTYYQRPNSVNYLMYWANQGIKWGTNQTDLENAVASFDSAPTLVKMIK